MCFIKRYSENMSSGNAAVESYCDKLSLGEVGLSRRMRENLFLWLFATVIIVWIRPVHLPACLLRLPLNVPLLPHLTPSQLSVTDGDAAERLNNEYWMGSDQGGALIYHWFQPVLKMMFYKHYNEHFLHLSCWNEATISLPQLITCLMSSFATVSCQIS